MQDLTTINLAQLYKRALRANFTDRLVLTQDTARFTPQSKPLPLSGRNWLSRYQHHCSLSNNVRTRHHLQTMLSRAYPFADLTQLPLFCEQDQTQPLTAEQVLNCIRAVTADQMLTGFKASDEVQTKKSSVVIYFNQDTLGSTLH